MDPIFFASQAEFRAWLLENHDREPQVEVGYYKVGSGLSGITYKESVDEGLCFGWIDGVRRSIDGQRYANRFTPRKPRSIWSQVNLKRFEELRAAGLVHAAGLKIFESRDVRMVKQYSSEQNPEDLVLPPAYEARFRAEAEAWEKFQAMPLSYTKAAIWWVISAKQEATREKRMADLIANSADGQKVPPLRRKNEGAK